MNATETVVDFLAVARLTRLVQEDTVPVGAARELVLDLYPDAKATQLLVCAWCASPWLAVLVALARWRYPRAWPVIGRVLAASAVTGHLSELADR